MVKMTFLATSPERDRMTDHSNHIFARPPKDPLAITLCAVFAVSAGFQAITGLTSNAIALLLPYWVRLIWLGMVMLGCIAILVGTFWKQMITGMIIESWGLLMTSFGLFVYGSSLFAVAVVSEIPNTNSAAVLAGPLTVALSGGFYWKRRQLERILGRLTPK